MFKTKREFERFFRSVVLPQVRSEYKSDGRIDYPARREAWNNILDAMAEDREVPKRGVEWVCPW